MSSEATGDASSTPYQYEHLNSNTGEIRLIKITNVLEDHDKGAIVLELDIQHTPIDKTGPYVAISYAWGNPARTHKLFVNGAALFVPENTFRTLYTVYHALPTLQAELRVPSSPVPLWIDAVCLNQSDLKEKDEQVPRMGQIYSQAAGTIGYIGRPSQGKTPFDGFRTLLWMGNDVGLTLDDVPADVAHSWFSESARDPDRFEEEVGPLEKFLEAYKDLFLNDWFVRGWVVQEMVLSCNTVCVYGYGSEFASMSFDVLMTLLDRSHSTENIQQRIAVLSTVELEAESSWARHKREFQAQTWSRIRDNLQQGQAPQLRLLGLLQYTRFGEVSDPRDRIYSLMGLIQEQDRLAIRVDYSDNYTPEDLFLDIAVHFLGSTNCCEVLGWAGLRYNRTFHQLPSWVPDWSKEYKSPMLAEGQFSASGNISHPLTVHDGGRRICARGIAVDTITSRTPPMGTVDDPALPEILWVLHYAAQLCLRLQREAIAMGSHASDTYQFNKEPWQDVIWRTCCMDRERFHNRRASLDVRPAFVACLERFGFGTDPLAIVEQDRATGKLPMERVGVHIGDRQLKKVSQVFELQVFASQRERIFGITGREGLIGSFPEHTRDGDIVVVLIGVELPVVLRPLERPKGEFQLVGTCYVHGIMDGEWITHVTDGKEEGSEGFQDFVIH